MQVRHNPDFCLSRLRDRLLKAQGVGVGVGGLFLSFRSHARERFANHLHTRSACMDTGARLMKTAPVASADFFVPIIITMI